jgi:type IV pilus assembly protein PilO
VILVTLLLAFLFFFSSMLPFGYGPRGRVIAALDGEHEVISADLMKAKYTASRLPQVKAEYEDASREWYETRALLATEGEVADFFAQVVKIGQRLGIECVLLEPKTPVPCDGYVEIPIEITVQGEYHNTVRYVRQICLERLIKVQSIDLEQEAESAQGGLPELLEARIRVTLLGT